MNIVRRPDWRKASPSADQQAASLRSHLQPADRLAEDTLSGQSDRRFLRVVVRQLIEQDHIEQRLMHPDAASFLGFLAYCPQPEACRAAKCRTAHAVPRALIQGNRNQTGSHAGHGQRI